MAVFSHIGILFVFLIIFFFSGITGRSKGSSARKCERISPFFGGDVMYHDGHAFYSCEDAYSLYPSDIDYSNCTKHGNWKPKPPRCLRKAHIELPQHGYVCKGKKDIILHKETYAICCDRGYELYSDQYLGKKRANIRNNNGSLEPGIPECVEARKCERVSPFFGGDVTYHDGQAFYSCEDAYSLFPSDIDYSNCTKHGNWKPKPPQCLRKAHVELPHHGHICKGKSDIILHKETYAICCDRGYELYSDQYLEKKRVIIRNNNGSLEPRIPECVEARCDSSDLYMANVQHINGSNILTTFESRTHVLLSCKDGYGYYKYDRQMTTPLKRKCIKGTIQRPPMCEEAMCLFPGYPSSRNTYHRVYQADARFIMDGQYLEPQQQVEVFCHKKEHYELYVNSTETYLDEFISECRYGQFNHTMEEFPTCVERRCSFSISDEVCLWTDDKEHCESKNFTIPSRSSVHMRCRDGYKHSWSEDGTSIEDDKDALIMCNRGVYVENYTCIPELCFVPSVKHAKLISNNASSYYHGEKITFVCNHGFNLHKKERFETICHLGKWKHTIPPECQPDLCSLSLYTGITIWVNSTLLTEDHGKIKTFENGTNLQIECKEGYTMKDIKSGQQVPSTRKLVTCLLGKWTRRYSCYAERCTAPMIIHARLQHTDERVYDHNKTVTFLCDKGYHFYQNISTEVKTLETTCNFGRWSDTIPSACNPDGCKPDMLHGSTYYKDDIIVELGKETLVKHRTTIRMQCKNMFDLFDEDNNILRDKEYKPAMACYQGKWQNRHFCKKRCVTFNVTNGRLITEGGNVNVGETIAHGERVFVETNNTKPDSDLAKDLLFDSAIKCHDGEWHNLNGLSSSFAPDITTQIPTTLSTDTTTLSESESENNGSKGVFPDKNQTHNTGNKGEMQVNNYRHGCTLSDDPRYTYKDSDGLEKDPGSFQISDGITLTVACTTQDMSFDANYGNDYNNHNDSTSTITCTNNTLSEMKLDCPGGCTLSKDRRYKYENSSGKKIKPGSIIYDNTTLHVTCAIIDLDELVKSYYDYEYNTDDSASYPTITCANNTLSQLELDCPVVETCLELKDGNVRMENGDFMVSCDKGYSLNLTISVDPKCTCKNGTLKSVYGDQIPHCIPDNCIIPYEFDGHLSVTNNNFVSLSGGSVVAVGEFVYLNCSKADGPNYEPFNRRFTCSNGMWTEAERDENWKLGYNGKFPECRAAKCEPDCANGGVCSKDDTCQCRHLTEGKRCENVICDVKCNVNGGKCIGPGECQCPQGKSGKYCEQDGCLLPKDAAKYKDSRRTVFSSGETLTTFSCPAGFILSSRNGMTCQDGVWSNIVKCVKVVIAATYLISVKTGNNWKSGTDAKVYITLHGLNGSTNRIYLQGSFEADDLDETRVPAKDVRPITSVMIGHDGSGVLSDWYLEYVSIYVENMEEYYVFRHNDWVIAETDISLPRQGLDQQLCIASFDSGNSWWPRWSSIGNKYLGKGMSLRGCKQACINLQTMACVAVSYEKPRKTCRGLAESDIRYFDLKHGSWNSPVYLQTCKHFD